MRNNKSVSLIYFIIYGQHRQFLIKFKLENIAKIAYVSDFMYNMHKKTIYFHEYNILKIIFIESIFGLRKKWY